ncbi:DUF4139 domain-containing protein [Piscibacillus halophilus]|uniref:DUF4139 domain-containing protein n=1 Tax=Piscibacillus halophilus TaxID=571933 RepID=UPI00240A5356|nr:DUF4139 domain-containing protein [Piscibacillus halophilus]
MFISKGQDTKDLAITVYNQNFAVVKDQRSFDGYNQEHLVRFEDVSEKIETDSIIVDGLNIKELNYDHDLVNKEKLLKKYTGQEVQLVDSKTREKDIYRLLSVENGLVLEHLETGEIVLNPPEENLILPKLPNGLIIKPSLIWEVEPKDVDEVHVTYTTGGLRWKANYVIHLNGDTFDLTAWLLLHNESGTNFENVRLKLIAGDVNRVTEEDLIRLPDEPGVLYDVSPPIIEKSFSDFHLYTLQRKTTIKNQQEKQITLFEATGVPFKRYYRLENHENEADIMLKFYNSEDQNLGMPFPAGKVKVYSEDEADGSLELVGEDQINHQSINTDVELNLGKAFDINCDNRQIDRYKQGIYEYFEYQYEIRNNKGEVAPMNIAHHIRHRHWEMVESSHAYDKVRSDEIEFNVDVPANEEETINFKYRVNTSTTIKVR